jgi:hypothetical protein
VSVVEALGRLVVRAVVKSEMMSARLNIPVVRNAILLLQF